MTGSGYGGSMDVDAAANQVRAGLREAADPERAAAQAQYLRSDIEHWGVSVPETRKVVRAVGRSIGHDDLRTLVDELWASAVFDQRLAGALLLDRHSRELRAADLSWLEPLVAEAGTWALVDVLVPRPLAAADDDDASATTEVLDRWAEDENFWLRRSALLAHLVGLRAGAGDWTRFARYADALLEDREFFVRKAIGWVLRDAGRRDPARVAAWAAPRTDRISGVALREAVKPLDPATAELLLKAYRAGQPADLRPAPR